MGTQVRLTLVGPLTVSRAGRIWATTDVGSRKARTALALLAVERGRLVRVDRIAEILWGKTPPRRPAENVATLVSRLRTAFGPDVITGGRTGYRLGPHVVLDIDEAADLVAQARRELAGADAAAALAPAGAAVAILANADLLENEADAPWLASARAGQAALLRRARHCFAEAALRTWNATAAREAGEAAVRADPLDETAHRLLMRAHAAAGEPARALAVFERLRRTLADELGADPAPATLDLHVAILQRRLAASENAGAFTGRDSELARLSAAWESVLNGGPRVALICGEAGSGKTSLADRLARVALDSGGTLARARCHEAERSLLLQPFVELLAQLAAGLPAEELREAAGEQAGLLAPFVPGLPVGPHTITEPRWIYEAVAGFLARLTAARPALLILDDLHHAGADTVALLHYLARHAAAGRFLTLATVRVEDGQHVLDLLAEVSERIELGPLDAAAIARLAQAAGQGPLAVHVHERTRGHTLSVVETLRGLAAGEKGIPAALRSSVLSRVRRAGPQAEELLRAAAVAGSPFFPATLAALLGLGPGEAARRCERILRTRLVVVAGHGYEFANELVREILYDSTPAPTRHVYRSEL